MPVIASQAYSRDRLFQIARALPADLEIFSVLGELLHNVNSELDDIAALLRRDVALSARIVRISNSAVFGGGDKIASIEEAVHRVGFTEILKLVGTATAARITEQSLSIYDVSGQQLRDNMLFGACASEALARLSGVDARMAYMAALLRPLGLMVLERAARGNIEPGLRFTMERWPSYAAWEGGLFGIDNCEVTGVILDEWRFPREVSLALRSHYVRRSGDSDRQLACLLNVASGLAHRCGRSLPGEACWWELTAEKLSAARLGADDIEFALVNAEQEFQAAITALGE